MGMVKENSIALSFLITILLFGSCNRVNDCLGISFPRHKISQALKQTVVSEDSVYVIDLQTLFEERIDSVFYFNGLLLSSEIAEITGLPAVERGAVRTLQDTQSRIILFSAGEVFYYESFRISLCFIKPEKTNRAKYSTLVMATTYNNEEFVLEPL